MFQTDNSIPSLIPVSYQYFPIHANFEILGSN